MSSRKPSRLATPLAALATSPAQDFADAVDHGRRLLGDRLSVSPQMAAVLEIDGPFVLFASGGPGAAAAVHDELHRRLASQADTVLSVGAFRFLLISDAADAEHARRIARCALEQACAPLHVSDAAAVVVGVVGAVFLERNAEPAAGLQRTAMVLNEARRRGRRLLMGHDLEELGFSGPADLADQVEQLERAFRQNRFRLARQPVLHARTGELLHHEALLRVIEDDASVRSAAPLIATAELLEVSSRLDLTVLEKAGEILAADPTCRLAVNISAASVRDLPQARRWLDRCQRLDGACERLTVELTETAVPDDVTGVVSGFASEVRRLGARFSLDDFGSGYTSFRNLLRLAPDEVKIDGAFIRDMRHDPRSRALVRALTQLARDLGASTVAEWVESADDAKAATDLGVDALQGFHIGMPEVDAEGCDLRRIA